jgi:hypothetical protein
MFSIANHHILNDKRHKTAKVPLFPPSHSEKKVGSHLLCPLTH